MQSLLLAALFSFVFSEEFQPQVAHPEHAHHDPGADHHRPRRPRPRRQRLAAGAAAAVRRVVEPHHPHEPRRPEHRPHGGVRGVERERQPRVRRGRRGRAGAPHAGERPQVLREAGGLGEHLHDEQRAGAAARRAAAGGEHVERGEVVRHEEALAREEDEVVRQVDGEVGRAEVEGELVGARVGRREVAGDADAAAARVGQHGAERERRRRRAVEQRREAARRLRPLRAAPPPEHDEVPDEVYSREHRQERQEHGLRRRLRARRHCRPPPVRPITTAQCHATPAVAARKKKDWCCVWDWDREDWFGWIGCEMMSTRFLKWLEFYSQGISFLQFCKLLQILTAIVFDLLKLCEIHKKK